MWIMGLKQRVMDLNADGTDDADLIVLGSS